MLLVIYANVNSLCLISNLQYAFNIGQQYERHADYLVIFVYCDARI